MDIKENWDKIRQVFRAAFKSNRYYAFATVDEHGSPHVTPIGSLILKHDGTGFFSEKFPEKTRQNFEKNDRVAVLAVNTSLFYWFKSIRNGVFETPPGVRIYGKVGSRRKATPEEKALWQKKVSIARRTKGYAILWKDMEYVRDIYFDDARPVSAGVMTHDLWK
jgi:predicted pyridoxine 5'-phosphate oxidase superfamily flavin-nucleotide-binding protein